MSRFGRLVLLAGGVIAGACVLSGPTAVAEPPDNGQLQADIIPLRSLYSPNRPIWVRFTLRNTSDEPVEILVAEPVSGNGGISLPVSVVLGSEDDQALRITYRDDKPVPVEPTAAEMNADASAERFVLRLAPRGSIGTELDLRLFHRALRYAGTYQLEWTPLAGRAGRAVADFRVEARKQALIVTDQGKMTFSLMYDDAPLNVENFLDLAREGFYDGKTIHRVIPGFLIQGGCPKGDGTGIRPDGKLIPAEFHEAPFKAGTLALARKPSDPNSASCQFFVTLKRLPDLDGRYTIIGQADDEESMRTLNAIAEEPTDRNYRPRIPLIIRSVNLIDAEPPGTIRLDLVPGRASAAPAERESPPAEEAAPPGD